MSEIKHTTAYFDSSHGRIYCHQWNGTSGDQSSPDIVLLHPMPHDGMFFRVIAPLLAVGRTVIAPDLPGYGGSDSLEETPTIGMYADAMVDVLRSRERRGPADLFGFHTGCLVATELSLHYPDEVHRLVQVDVPYFDPLKREELMAGDHAVGGFIAAFSYPGEERYPHIRHDCLVIATASSLLEPSRAAAAVIPDCFFREMPDVYKPVMENGAGPIAACTRNFLDQ